MADEETLRLIELAVSGDGRAYEALLAPHRARLRRMVALRLDRRLYGRIDPSDVIQEACVDALRRISEYVAQPSVSFYLWLRFLTVQRLAEQLRRHLGAQARDVGREISIYGRPFPEATSAALAAQLLGRRTDPCDAAIRAERKAFQLESGQPPLVRRNVLASTCVGR